jgi:hypothetical protein
MSVPELETRHEAEVMDPVYRSVPKLAGMDWLIRSWRYFDSRLSAVRYLIAACAFYGGICFLIGAVCAAVPAIVDVYTGGWQTYAWTVTFTFFVGSYLFTLGCFLLSVEAINRDYPVELAQWKAGQRPHKPRFRFLWMDPSNLGWWGGVSYTFGALLYNVGTTAALSTCFDGVTFSDKMIKYLTYLPFLLGGPFFFASGVLYCVEFTGPNVLKGALPIPGFVKREDLNTFTYWVNFSNFWGGLLFMMSGFWGYAYESISVWQWRVQNLIGFGVGAVFFSTAGLLLFIQMSLARCCTPSEADGRPVTPKYAEASARSDSQSAPVSAASSASSRQHLLKV